MITRPGAHTLLPDFLVIGAQKCGTTTLFEDLRSHPGIGLADKESSVLLGSATASGDGIELPEEDLCASYARTLPRGASGCLLGEVATGYSMLPRYPNAISNAVRVLPNAKIIYIVREPVARVVSHHHHDFGYGLTGPDINTSVHTHEELLNNSRYATQIQPWLDAYGSDAVLVLKFEDYVADRQASSAKVFSFLGVHPSPLPDPQLVHNAGESKRVGVGLLGRVAHSELYRTHIRGQLPESMRRRLSGRLLPKAPPRPAPPSPETVQFVINELWPEVTRLAELLGTDPWWDRDDVAHRWTANGYSDGD